MNTFRIYHDNKRLSTAVPLKNGSCLQVFPEKKIYENERVWKAIWPGEVVITIRKAARARRHKSNLFVERRNREIMQFSDPDYAWLFKSVEVKMLPDPVVYAVLQDDSVWTLQRSLNYLMPPSIRRNGEPVTKHDEEYSPAYTMLYWLMMQQKFI